MSISGEIDRKRNQQETKDTYNPDLEYVQQALANELYGPGAAIGSYGMSGGQYPTANKDPAGFGSGGYGYPGQYHGTGSNSEGYQGQAGNGSLYYGGQPGGGGGFNYSPNLYAGGSSGARQQLGQEAYNLYSGLVANAGKEGLSPEEAQRVRTSGDVAARSPYERARFDIARRAGLTGDSASVAASRAQLAPQESIAASDAARASEMGITNEAERRRELALQFGGQGLQSLYSGEGGLLATLLGQRGNLASLKQRTYTSGASTGGKVQGSYGFSGGGGG